MRQSSDPEFAQILNRIREGANTDDDMKRCHFYICEIFSKGYRDPNQMHKLGNLPGTLKMRIGARVKLTTNINTSGRSAGKTEYMQMPKAHRNLACIINFKFGNVDAGNSLKKNS